MPKETVIRDRVGTRLGAIIDDGREMVARCQRSRQREPILALWKGAAA